MQIITNYFVLPLFLLISISIRGSQSARPSGSVQYFRISKSMCTVSCSGRTTADVNKHRIFVASCRVVFYQLCFRYNCINGLIAKVRIWLEMCQNTRATLSFSLFFSLMIWKIKSQQAVSECKQYLCKNSLYCFPLLFITVRLKVMQI